MIYLGEAKKKKNLEKYLKNFHPSNLKLICPYHNQRTVNPD